MPKSRSIERYHHLQRCHPLGRYRLNDPVSTRSCGKRIIGVLTIGNFTDTLSGGVGWDGGYIVDAQTGTIVRLV
jgi:hypothetical protein